MTNRFDSLYRDNPHGDALSWVAVDDSSGLIVAVTSLFPRYVVVNGLMRRGSIGGDSYVQPRARRQGLATRLHLATNESMRASGIEFHYGAPDVVNLRALAKAGGTAVTSFRRYVRPLSSEFLGEQIVASLPGVIPPAFGRMLGWCSLSALNAIRRTRVTEYVVEKADRFGSEWDVWFEQHTPSDGIYCVRDSAYMNFRYSDIFRNDRKPSGAIARYVSRILSNLSRGLS